jgi:hypothetical protein
MTDPTTDCPACPKCGVTDASPQLADQAGHGWDGRHRTYDPRALWCPHCGHGWIEADLDRVAQSWRAQAAYYAMELEGRAALVMSDPSGREP